MSDQRLYKKIANDILEMIRSGAYPRNTRLPGERELAEKYGVSRVIIREAEIALEALGHVSIKVGSGVYVLDADAQIDASLPKISAFELTQTRLLFESECAALAASTITEKGIQELEATVQRMAEAATDKKAGEAADQDFHLLIAASTGNKAIEHFVRQLWRMRTEIEDVRNVYEGVCETDVTARIAEHEMILDAIRRRDAEGARKAMKLHFTRLLEALLEVSERVAIEEALRRSEANRARFLGGLQEVAR